MIKVILMMSITLSATSIPETPCNRLHINNTWYDREVILSNYGKPYSLNVHKSMNTLYFSYSLSDTYYDVDFQLAYMHLDTKENGIIAGIRSGCAVAIDQGNDDVYLGGSDGIYKYNMFTKIADVYKEKGRNIWSLYYKENLFCITYPDQKLYIEIDGHFVKVSEFENFEVDNFYMAANKDIYFANKTGFYKFNNANASIDMVNELLTVRQINEDNDGRLYLSTNFGIYVSNGNDFEHIVNLKNIYGITFDKDNNLIFSEDKNIIRLRASSEACVEDFHW